MAVAVSPNSLSTPESLIERRTESTLHLVPEPTSKIYQDRFSEIAAREAAHLTTPEGRDTIKLHLGRVSFLRFQLENYDPDPKKTPSQQVTATAEQLDLHTSILQLVGVEIPPGVF